MASIAADRARRARRPPLRLSWSSTGAVRMPRAASAAAAAPPRRQTASAASVRGVSVTSRTGSQVPVGEQEVDAVGDEQSDGDRQQEQENRFREPERHGGSRAHAAELGQGDLAGALVAHRRHDEEQDEPGEHHQLDGDGERGGRHSRPLGLQFAEVLGQSAGGHGSRPAPPRRRCCRWRRDGGRQRREVGEVHGRRVEGPEAGGGDVAAAALEGGPVDDDLVEAVGLALGAPRLGLVGAAEAPDGGIGGARVVGPDDG